MSKGAVGLVAGYWPEDVYRYLATPGLALDEALVSRPAKRRGAAPAAHTASGDVSYEALARRVDQAAGAIHTWLPGLAGRLAVAVGDTVETLVLLLAALTLRRTVLLMDPSVSDAVLARQIVGFAADLVVADSAVVPRLASAAPDRPLRFASVEELGAVDARPPRTKPRVILKGPAVALPGPGGADLVYHSHTSLLAGALSWATFLRLQEDDVLLAWAPLATWEGLYSVLPTLFRGAAFATTTGAEAADARRLLQRHRPRHALLPFAEATRLATARTAGRALLEGSQGVFVSVPGPFRVTERRRLQSVLGAPVLTVYGRPDAGPVLASHPEWFLDEAVGIPVTNVDVWPLSPATGNPLEVPWETVEHGEVGVKSPMIAVDRVPARPEEVREGWLRTGVVATMDPSGLFYFLSGGAAAEAE